MPRGFIRRFMHIWYFNDSYDTTFWYKNAHILTNKKFSSLDVQSAPSLTVIRSEIGLITAMNKEVPSITTDKISVNRMRP